jgi:hypothetical protein
LPRKESFEFREGFWFPVSGFWFLVSGFRFLEKKPFSVGRASVPAQASSWQQPLFSWFVAELFISL